MHTAVVDPSYVYIDDVSVVEAPEPSSYALMVAGLAGLGVAARRPVARGDAGVVFIRHDAAMSTRRARGQLLQALVAVVGTGLAFAFLEAGALRNRAWAYWGGTARLPFTPDGQVPARTLLLAGTPGGTVFAGVDARAIGRGVARWLAGGWDRPVTWRAIESYIALARQQQRYLQPGDRITIRVDGLGSMDSPVVR